MRAELRDDLAISLEGCLGGAQELGCRAGAREVEPDVDWLPRPRPIIREEVQAKAASIERMDQVPLEPGTPRARCHGRQGQRDHLGELPAGEPQSM